MCGKKKMSNPSFSTRKKDLTLLYIQLSLWESVRSLGVTLSKPQFNIKYWCIFSETVLALSQLKVFSAL